MYRILLIETGKYLQTANNDTFLYTAYEINHYELEGSIYEAKTKEEATCMLRWSDQNYMLGNGNKINRKSNIRQFEIVKI
jgi:hypothetical protein